MTQLNRLLLIAVILFAAAQSVSAQDTVWVQPDSALLEGSFIQPYTNQWKVSVIDSSGNKQHMRYWTDYAQILELDGVSYLHRVQDLYSPEYGLQQTWINTVQHADLTPLRYSLESTNGNLLHLNFDGNKVTQRAFVEGEFKSEEFETEHHLYDWNLYGILLIGLPFQKNISYKIPYWSQQTKTEEILTATLEGQERVQTLSGNNHLTQKITTDKGLTFWLTKQKPYVIQLTLALPNGSTMIWEMM
jgi:hypothetical protein